MKVGTESANPPVSHTASLFACSQQRSRLRETAARIGDRLQSRRRCDGRVHDGLEFDGRRAELLSIFERCNHFCRVMGRATESFAATSFKAGPPGQARSDVTYSCSSPSVGSTISSKRTPGPAKSGVDNYRSFNALAETVNGYYKAELVRGPACPGPWEEHRGPRARDPRMGARAQHAASPRLPRRSPTRRVRASLCCPSRPRSAGANQIARVSIRPRALHGDAGPNSLLESQISGFIARI